MLIRYATQIPFSSKARKAKRVMLEHFINKCEELSTKIDNLETSLPEIRYGHFSLCNSQKNIFHTINSFEEYHDHSQLDDTLELLEARVFSEKLLEKSSMNEYPFYCYTCQSVRILTIDRMLTISSGINWRETLLCPSCLMQNRQRASVHLFHKLFSEKSFTGKTIYLTEAITPLYNYFKNDYHLIFNTNPLTVVGSEYFGDQYQSGELVNDIRHEDIEKLSLENNSVASILSFDVFEHVADYKKGFAEAYRVLEEDGFILFTVPFDMDSRENIIDAVLNENGEVKYLTIPKYHGNPVCPEEGSLVFTSFGWDLLKDLGKIGFRNVRQYFYYSNYFGYLGSPGGIVVAYK